MTVVFDTYVPGTSYFHRLDPRVKLWSMLLAVILAFLLPDLVLPALFLFVIHVVLLIVEVPWHTLARLWREMSFLIVLICVLQPFARPSGQILAELGPLCLTAGGIVNAINTALRTLNIAFVVGGLLFTTEHRALIQGFVALGFPYTWGLTISLALRFLPAIQSLFQAVRDAQAARGWISEGSILQRIRDYIPILVAVLIGILRMSDDLTLALAARGLGASHSRTSWCSLRMTGQDWFFAAATTGASALFLIWWHLVLKC